MKSYGSANIKIALLVTGVVIIIATLIYTQVLVNLASPLIPTWAQWICDRLQQMDRLGEMAGTLKVVEVSADEPLVDELVSEGIRTGQINFCEGGSYAGVH